MVDYFTSEYLFFSPQKTQFFGYFSSQKQQHQRFEYKKTHTRNHIKIFIQLKYEGLIINNKKGLNNRHLKIPVLLQSKERVLNIVYELHSRELFKLLKMALENIRYICLIVLEQEIMRT